VLTPSTRANFEVRDPLFVDLGGQQEFKGIVAQSNVVFEKNDGQAVIEHFERGFFAFPLQAVAHHKDRLPSTLGAQVFQRALRRRGAGKLACLVAGVGSEKRHNWSVLCGRVVQ